SEEIKRRDGSTMIGRVINEEGGNLSIMANPFMPDDLTRVPTADVVSRKTYNISQMPPGLINGFNEEELRDLVAYILSGGNPQSPMFKK
ncbi:MAG TPA: hypothetical protein VGE76_06800, partial [Opitutaceae bacterium]